MRKVKIPKKKNGEFRTIYEPSKKEKETLRGLFPTILTKALSICDPNVCQGFLPNTSPVTNALKHVGYKYTTMFDLKDFFDSVQREHLELEGLLTDEELDSVLYEGAPRQGLPTSPIVANIAASKMDREILDWIKIWNFNMVYTRYADDLAFSYNYFQIGSDLKKNIKRIVEANKFYLNSNKTRTMSAKNGRRIITGVAVDGFIHPTRRVKRKMRAALHSGRKNKYFGLKEWCKMKRPKAIVKAEIEELKGNFPNELRIWANSAYNSEKMTLE